MVPLVEFNIWKLFSKNKKFEFEYRTFLQKKSIVSRFAYYVKIYYLDPVFLNERIKKKMLDKLFKFITCKRISFIVFCFIFPIFRTKYLKRFYFWKIFWRLSSVIGESKP